MGSLLCVAQDVSPSWAFKAVERECKERGIKSRLLIGGDVRNEDVKEAVKDASAVLVGMSSTAELAAKEILALEEARSLRKPYGFFSDTRRCWKGRPHFDQFKGGSSFLFVTYAEDVEAAGEMYPKAHIVLTGHPLREVPVGIVPSGEEIRYFLGLTTELVVLYAGTKEQDLNIEALDIIEAGIEMFQQRKMVKGLGRAQTRIIFAPHPGEIDEKGRRHRAPYRLFEKVWIVEREELPSSYLLKAADLLVNTLSNLFLEAAYERVPTVTIQTTAVAAARMKLTGVEEPSEATEGSMRLAWSSYELALVIEEISTKPDYFIKEKTVQRELYPEPQAAGTAARIIAESLSDWLKDSEFGVGGVRGCVLPIS